MKHFLLGFSLFMSVPAMAEITTQDLKLHLNGFYLDADSNVGADSNQALVFQSLCEESVSQISAQFKSEVAAAGLDFETQFRVSGGTTTIHWLDGSGFRGMSCDIELVSLTSRAQFSQYSGAKHFGASADEECAQELASFKPSALIANTVVKTAALLRRASCQVVATFIRFSP